MVTHDDDRLWDELSHQQSREIQQHMAHPSRGSMALQALHNAATNLRSVASAAIYRPVHTVDQPPQNLADFGIQDESRADPLLGEQVYGYEEFASGSSHLGAGRSEFVFLERFRLLPRRDGWGAVANLDLFFTSLYNYYYHRGLMPILCKGIVELVSLFLTLALSVFLFAYVDWNELSSCTNEASCKKTFGEYLITSPFSKFSLWNSIVILYCLLFTCYGVFAVWSFLHTIKDALESRAFFEERLGIFQHKLEGGAIEWDRDVVQKIVDLQNSGEYRVAIHNGELDGLVIAQRILRKENFLIALFNRNMLDFSLPLIPGTFFSKSLEWSVYFCVLNYMFNHKYLVRPAFYLDPISLKRRFMLCGIAHVVFMPFLLFFMTLHFGMQNLYDWKSTKQYMGPKEWSLSAKWLLREFNELPHFLERRLEPSYKATENYLNLFTQSEIVTTIGRILALLGGSLGAVLLVFAAINDAILLHVKIGDWNLLWYVGMLGVIYSTGKAMLPDPKIHPRYTRNLFAEIDNCLSHVAVHTHFFPDIWNGRGWEKSVYNQVSAMFMYKAKLFAFEVVSVILAPIVLCVSLPRCAESICEFVMAIKAEVPGAGEVCGYATFDFDKFGDETWEGRTMGKADLSGSISASVHEMHDVEAAIRLHPTPKAFMGKMEKSFFSFKATHPSWKATVSGQTLVDRLENFREIEAEALAREQEHHMEAAAKQLETLIQMEQQSKRVDPAITSGISRLNESYLRQRAAVTRATGGADSGGGAPARTTQPPLVPLTPARQIQNDSQMRTPPMVNHFSTLEQPTRQRELTPLPFASSPDFDETQSSTTQASLRPLRSPSPNSAALSILHYADAGLSTELQRMLNRSTLDPDLSVSGSMLGRLGAMSHGPSYGHLASLLENEQSEQESAAAAERQYMLLERFHAHLSNQRHPGGVVIGGQSFVSPNSRPVPGGSDHMRQNELGSQSSTL